MPVLRLYSHTQTRVSKWPISAMQTGSEDLRRDVSHGAEAPPDRSRLTVWVGGRLRYQHCSVCAQQFQVRDVRPRGALLLNVHDFVLVVHGWKVKAGWW